MPYERELVKGHETAAQAPQIFLPVPPINMAEAERVVDVAVRALEEAPVPDGERLMLLITSNAYRDREDEIIKQDALEHWVSRAWKGDQYVEPHTEHLMWHGGDPIGELVFSEMEGPFLIEVSRELPDAVINLADDGEEPYTVSRATLWDALEGRTDMGASHRFAFKAGDEEDGIYEAIVKVESSTLPRRRAANPWTLSQVIRKGSNMDNEKKGFFDQLFGKDGSADAVAEATADAAAALDKAGVERKDLTKGNDRAEKAQKIAEKLWLDIDLNGVELPESFGATITQAIADGAAELLRIEQETQAAALAASGGSAPAPPAETGVRQAGEGEDVPPPAEDAPPPEEKQTAEEVAAALATAVFDASGGDLSALTAEDLAALLAAALQPTSDMPDEDMPAQAEAARALREKALQDMADYIAQSTKDLGDIAQVVVAQKGQIAALEDEVKALRGLIDSRPRSATQAAETDLSKLVPPSPNGKANAALDTLKQDVEKGVQGKKLILGVEVSD